MQFYYGFAGVVLGYLLLLAVDFVHYDCMGSSEASLLKFGVFFLSLEPNFLPDTPTFFKACFSVPFFFETPSISMPDFSSLASLSSLLLRRSCLRCDLPVRLPLTPSIAADLCFSRTPARFLETRSLMRLTFCQLVVLPLKEELLVPPAISGQQIWVIIGIN